MPGVLAGIRIERQDRCQVQVVAAARTANLAIPRRAITDTDVQEIDIGIVGEGIPGGTATAHRPPLPRPGFCGSSHRLGLETVCGIAGHGVRFPGLLTGLGIVRRHESTNPELGATIANDDFAFDDARRSRDGKGRRPIDCVDLPYLFPAFPVDGDQVAVKCGHIDLVVPKRRPPIGHITACISTPATWRLRVESPDFLAGNRIQSKYDAPGRGDIHDTIVNEWRGLHRAVGIDIEIPGQPKVGHIAVGDLCQRAEALLVIGASVGQPVTRLCIGVDNSIGRHRTNRSVRRVARRSRCILVAATGSDQESDNQ